MTDRCLAGNAGKKSLKLLLRLSTAGVALGLAACGGGNGGGGTTPIANHPPTFTSVTTASVTENFAGSFYQAAATDPDNNAITYSISGGSDAARFVLDGDRLRFAAAPNYDLPTDSDEDNVYLVQITASDGQATTTLDLRVTVTNDREGVVVRRIGTGFDRPVGFVSIPGDTRVFVPERGGRIFLFDPTSGTKTLFLTVNVSTVGEGGLAAIAPMADYAKSGQFVVLYTASNGALIAAIGQRSGIFGSPALTSETVLFAGMPAGASATGTAQLAADGKLYIATSDAIGATDPALGSQSATSTFGKLYVVERNPDPFAGVSPQYFLTRRIASGLRYPRGTTLLDGRLLLADRGGDSRHEVDLIDPTAGSNFGWPYKEGTVTVRSGAPAGLVDPALEYRFGTGPGMGTGIVGGVVYRGAIASLSGQYVFADRSGAIFATSAAKLGGTLITASTIERRRADFAPDVGTLSEPTAISADASGTLYIVDAGGDIFRVDAG